jgi:hypothetical protein
VTGDAPIAITRGAVSLPASDATQWTSNTRSIPVVPATGNTLISDPIQATSGTAGTGHARTPDDDTGSGNTNSQAGPTITLTAEQVGIGLYVFSGTVTADPTAVGLKVTFSGTPSTNGQSTTVTSTGAYQVAIEVQTNGTDIGTVTASVTDAAGNTATAQVYISPTPPPP